MPNPQISLLAGGTSKRGRDDAERTELPCLGAIPRGWIGEGGASKSRAQTLQWHKWKVSVARCQWENSGRVLAFINLAIKE